eukprot:scaffold13500_cov46-Phaeocystis_antarctica.AAC.2
MAKRRIERAWRKPTPKIASDCTEKHVAHSRIERARRKPTPKIEPRGFRIIGSYGDDPDFLARILCAGTRAGVARVLEQAKAQHCNAGRHDVATGTSKDETARLRLTVASCSLLTASRRNSSTELLLIAHRRSIALQRERRWATPASQHALAPHRSSNATEQSRRRR